MHSPMKGLDTESTSIIQRRIRYKTPQGKLLTLSRCGMATSDVTQRCGLKISVKTDSVIIERNLLIQTRDEQWSNESGSKWTTRWTDAQNILNSEENASIFKSREVATSFCVFVFNASSSYLDTSQDETRTVWNLFRSDKRWNKQRRRSIPKKIEWTVIGKTVIESNASCFRKGWRRTRRATLWMLEDGKVTTLWHEENYEKEERLISKLSVFKYFIEFK